MSQPHLLPSPPVATPSHRGTLVQVTANLCHEIGHIQKQSSFYFQALTAQVSCARITLPELPSSLRTGPLRATLSMAAGTR